MHLNPAHAYWRANLSLLTVCLIIWALVSYGFGILLQPVLDNYSIGGYKLGFWFAQQGSIYIFLLLIVFYSLMMRVIDRKYDVHED